MSFLLADIVWRPFTGARWGPAISVVHLLAALLCWRAAVLNGTNPAATSPNDKRSVSSFWLVLAIIMFGLSMNKFFNLQSILTIYGRSLAQEHGWYEQRQTLQAAIVTGTVLVIFIGMVLCLRMLRGRWREQGLAYFSVVFLLTLIAVRAASYSPIDRILYGLPKVGNRMNAGLELAATILVSLGAIQAARPFRHSDNKSPVANANMNG